MWRLLNLSLNFLPLLAQEDSVPGEGQRRLDPGTRMQLMMALALVLMLGGFAIIVIRVTGRLVRWYGRDRRDYRFAPRAAPDIDDWAHKPLLPPLDDSEAAPPRE
jgi:hypothetical protein